MVLFTCYSKQSGLINVKTVRQLINQTTCIAATTKAGISLPLTEPAVNLHAQTVSQINPHQAVASFSPSTPNSHRWARIRIARYYVAQNLIERGIN